MQAWVDELIDAGRADDRDPFVFEITRRADLTGHAKGAQLTVAARLGAQEFEQFPIDLTTGLAFVGTIQSLSKDLVVQIDEVQPPPPMRLYPIVDQIADKVAAIYEVYLGKPSGRFHDLVDLVHIITADVDIDADLLTRALTVQPTARRMRLPTTMVSPGPMWNRGYANQATRAPRTASHPHGCARPGGRHPRPRAHPARRRSRRLVHSGICRSHNLTQMYPRCLSKRAG